LRGRDVVADGLDGGVELGDGALDCVDGGLDDRRLTLLGGSREGRADESKEESLGKLHCVGDSLARVILGWYRGKRMRIRGRQENKIETPNPGSIYV